MNTANIQIKYGKFRKITVSKWIAVTNKKNPQWADYLPINLEDGLLSSVNCKINLKSNYLRFGFKLLDRNASVFSSVGLVNTNENNGLFHISKEIGDYKLFSCVYKDGVLEANPQFAVYHVQDELIKLELKIEQNNELVLKINDVKCYQSTIKTQYRERLILMAWGDGNNYELEVSDIDVLVKI